MMNVREKAKILEVIPCTEAMTFREFCSEYSETPNKGDRSEWGKLFSFFDELSKDGLVDIVRDRDRRIESLQLTAVGAQWIRDYLAGYAGFRA